MAAFLPAKSTVGHCWGLACLIASVFTIAISYCFPSMRTLPPPTEVKRRSRKCSKKCVSKRTTRLTANSAVAEKPLPTELPATTTVTPTTPLAPSHSTRFQHSSKKVLKKITPKVSFKQLRSATATNLSACVSRERFGSLPDSFSKMRRRTPSTPVASSNGPPNTSRSRSSSVSSCSTFTSSSAESLITSASPASSDSSLGSTKTQAQVDGPSPRSARPGIFRHKTILRALSRRAATSPNTVPEESESESDADVEDATCPQEPHRGGHVHWNLSSFHNGGRTRMSRTPTQIHVPSPLSSS